MPRHRFGGRRLARILAVGCVVVVCTAGSPAAQRAAPEAWPDVYRADTQRLIERALSSSHGWRRLAELTDTFGARFSGSENLARAIAWAAAALERDGLEQVRTEPVMVPRWIRGRESGEIVTPPRHELALLGLGGSVPTPPGGLEADVLIVESFEDLHAKSEQARGRIVLFDVPFTTYADTVTYRSGAARAAAQYGAVAALVRSIGPTGLRTPHTGSLQYIPGLRAIPAAAVAAEDANRMARLAARGETVRVRLTLESRQEPDVESANVVAEIRGRERPDEIVLIGGHIDSWDVGTGASDDAVGCIVTWEALRLMKTLGLRPRRTVRLVLFTNEENGFAGAEAYAARYAAATPERHVFALEADSGVFAPATLGFTGSTGARRIMTELLDLLVPLGFTELGPTGGGADIGPIAGATGIPTMAYLGDPAEYFVVHHTAADTLERIAPEDVARATAAIAVIAYVVAEMPEPLPR